MLAERILTRFLRAEIKRHLSTVEIKADATFVPVPSEPCLLYVHVPFCEHLCPWCSFTRYRFEEGPAREYFEHLANEIRMLAERGYSFSSMYVGGGTPTVLVDELCETIDLARRLFGITEVSCETNPNHLTGEILEKLSGRVRRLSVGVQTFDDELLRRIQRLHYGGGKDILDVIERAAGLFDTLNADLIFNLPGQDERRLREDIAKIIASSANQVTYYPLMTSSQVGREMENAFGKIGHRREAKFYDIIRRELEGPFRPSSAWCFSREDGGTNVVGEQTDMIDEYIVDYDQYVGAGCGAFSYLDGALYVNTFSPDEYIRRISAGLSPVRLKRRFSRRRRMQYRFMMDLFSLKLDKRAFRETFGVSVGRGLWKEMLFMRLAGAFERNDSSAITLTPRGRYLVVAMMREFFTALNNVRSR